MKIIKEFDNYIIELKKLGLKEGHAACYLCNFHDEFFCKIYNGGCENYKKCEEISQVFLK